MSHEIIYQHIILGKQTGVDLHTCLSGRIKHRKRYVSGKEQRGKIPNQISIEEHPVSAEAHNEPGADWEKAH